MSPKWGQFIHYPIISHRKYLWEYRLASKKSCILLFCYKTAVCRFKHEIHSMMLSRHWPSSIKELFSMQLHLNKQWYHGSIWSWFQAGYIEIYRCIQQSLSSKKDFLNICLKSSQTSIKAHRTWRLTFDSTTVASKLFNYWQDMGCLFVY